jgi:biotin carboxyl carrier protein
VASSQDAIKRVIEAFERSDWSEIDVRIGDLRVHLSAAAPDDSPVSAGRLSPPTPTTRTTPVVTREDPPWMAADTSESELVTGPLDTGAHLVVSPSPGIFWRSPEPGLPPFTDKGHTVVPATTVCIVEVMKLMTHVKAGVTGEVVAVYGKNGVSVQKGEALFAIAPSEPSA